MLSNVLEQCVTTCGKAAGIRVKRRSRARKEASAEEKPDITNSLLKQNTSSADPGLTTRVFDPVDLKKVKPKIM